MKLWGKKAPSPNIPVAVVPPRPEAERLSKMRVRQKKGVRKASRRIVGLGLTVFVLLEIAGNFSEFSRDYIAVTTITFTPKTFTGWQLTAHMASADVTLIITALLVFNATFGVAFIATFLVPAESKEFEYFRVDWAQTVQILAMNSASFSIALTLTRLSSDPALAVILSFLTLSVVMASELVNSSFLIQKYAAVAIVDWTISMEETNRARSAFLSTFNELARANIRGKEPSTAKEATKEAQHCRRLIATGCILIILLESIIIVALVPLFGFGIPRDLLHWIGAVLYIFVFFVVITGIPLALTTFGRSSLWLGASRGRPFTSLARVVGSGLTIVLTCIWLVPYVLAREPLVGAFIVVLNLVAVGGAAWVVNRAKRTGRGIGKLVPLHTLALLDSALFSARESRDEAQRELKDF